MQIVMNNTYYNIDLTTRTGHITLSIVSLDPNISFVTPSISAFENATSFYPKYLYQTSLYFVSNFQVPSHLSHLMTIKL